MVLQTLIQRACSADNSGSSGSSSRPTSVRRWSSEVFRSNSNVDEGKKLLQADENKNKGQSANTCFGQNEALKFHVMFFSFLAAVYLKIFNCFDITISF